MRGPIARPLNPPPASPSAPPITPETAAEPLATPAPPADARAPRAFTPAELHSIETEPPPFDTLADAELIAPPLPKNRSWAARLAWSAGGILVSLGLGLAADRLIRDLYARYEWLGWAGLVVLAVFVLALIAVATREIWSVRRLGQLDDLRRRAALALISDDLQAGRDILTEIGHIYSARPDLARARQTLENGVAHIFDGAEMIRFSERTLMTPLDARARALTAASARRVALVTAVSPRALVDIAFVLYESIRLSGAIAALYGARPGLLGFVRLAGSILGHLAVTGGLVLTDGIVEQLVGQGLAARLSARLGEGVVNGLMTVRVGIAAMRVVRPLPFDTQRQPVVKDFIGDLVNVAQGKTGS